MITEKQTIECSDALIEWFKSQECDPADGSLVMLHLMASQLVAKTTDINKLQDAVKGVMIILTCEIALQLKVKK